MTTYRSAPLTETVQAEIRRLRASGMTCREVANATNVGVSTVSEVTRKPARSTALTEVVRADIRRLAADGLTRPAIAHALGLTINQVHSSCEAAAVTHRMDLPEPAEQRRASLTAMLMGDPPVGRSAADACAGEVAPVASGAAQTGLAAALRVRPEAAR